jgi:hypothetical protein
VFAIGFIPDGGNLNALSGEHLKGLQLCPGLMRKTVTNPE